MKIYALLLIALLVSVVGVLSAPSESDSNAPETRERRLVCSLFGSGGCRNECHVRGYKHGYCKKKICHCYG